MLFQWQRPTNLIDAIKTKTKNYRNTKTLIATLFSNSFPWKLSGCFWFVYFTLAFFLLLSPVNGSFTRSTAYKFWWSTIYLAFKFHTQRFIFQNFCPPINQFLLLDLPICLKMGAIPSVLCFLYVFFLHFLTFLGFDQVGPPCSSTCWRKWRENSHQFYILSCYKSFCYIYLIGVVGKFIVSVYSTYILYKLLKVNKPRN